MSDERIDSLNSFLDGLFGDQEGGGILPVRQGRDFLDIPPTVYKAIEIPEHLNKKIKDLQKITTSIEEHILDVEFIPDQDFSTFKINYKNVLNPMQLLAVCTMKGPVLVIAGAGSGKTRVIVHRLSYMIENGIAPQRILLLTFTRKAANEMINRAEVLLKDNLAGKVTGGTFHSFASNVLRRHSNLLSLPADFTIADTADSEDVVDLIRTQLKFGEKDKKFPKKQRIYDIISSSRNRQIPIEKVIAREFTGLVDYVDDIKLIYSGYTKYKKLSRIFDFDDLMELLRDALRDNQVFRNKMQESFDYIMVDEFQDTNTVQKDIVDLLAGKHSNIMVVGDDAQSIYAFRGANFENILRFPETYPDCKIIKIEENYRSTQNILDFTNGIIDKALLGYKKKLFSSNKNSWLPYVAKFEDQKVEAAFIADRIMELIEGDIPLNEIAVLNRADWHNRYIQAELNKRDIPYVVVGGFRFNERTHVKDMVAYLRVILNPYDAVAWHRILKLIPGIGKKLAGQIVLEMPKSKGQYSFESFAQRSFYQELSKLGEVLNLSVQNELSVAAKIENLRNYYAPLMEVRHDDFELRILDINVLIDIASRYKSLDRFLSDFALEPPSRNVAGSLSPLVDENEESGKITISTIHSAKGLEWYSVFIPHALDGMLPSNRAATIEDMEEERRLFYVACSRAKEQLYITMPSYVASYNAYFHHPCRFLIEIERERMRIGDQEP